MVNLVDMILHYWNWNIPSTTSDQPASQVQHSMIYHQSNRTKSLLVMDIIIEVTIIVKQIVMGK